MQNTPNTEMPRIHPTAVLEAPFRPYQGCKSPMDVEYRPTVFGKRFSIGAFTVIGRGVTLAEGVVIDHHCVIEPNVSIGTDSLIIYGATLGADSVIGANCVIGGFVSEACLIEDNCRVFGKLVHRQADCSIPWDEFESPEPSAVVRESSFIGFEAVIVGGITVGPNAYVCAGAIVTRSVPPFHVALGVNRFVPQQEWKGALAQNPILDRRRVGR